MEKNNKNNGTKILLILFGALLLIGLGAGGMYAFVKKYPSITTINKLEKEVTVNENGIADAVEKVYDAVAVVEVYQRNTLYATGTGFIFKKDNNKYYIMTNYHVVSQGNAVKVVLTDGTSIETTLVGGDQYIDIAVLSFESDKDLSIAEIGSSVEARVGDTVFTVGAPVSSQIFSGSVTRGIISGKDRMVSVSTNSNSSSSDYIMKSIQTDAAINSGNSGGPLCNSNGQVIGITNMKLVTSGVEGMGFAIPIEDAIEYADNLINGNDTSRPFLGVSMAELASAQQLYYFYGIRIPDNVEKGAIVTEVQKDSPAEKAGIEAGDVITAINDKEVGTVAELKYELYKYKVGDTITIRVNHKGQERNVKVTLIKNQ